MARLTLPRSALVLMQGPWGRSFKIPITGMGYVSWMPAVRSSSQATATMASGRFSRTILLANVPPVATAIFK